MTFRIRIVQRQPVSVKRAWLRLGWNDCDYDDDDVGYDNGIWFTVARDMHGRVIAGHKWSMDGKMLLSLGTWVHHRWRRRGIARRLWARTLKHTRPTSIDMDSVTYKGRALIRSLRRVHPDVRWPPDDSCGSP